MRLNSIVFVACALGVQFSFAQKLVEVDAKAGFNYSNFNLSPSGKLYSTQYHAGSGFHIGGYALFELKKKWFLQPELLYSNQVYYFTTPNYSNLKNTLNYINIPILLKYYPIGSLNVQVGPQVGLLTSATGDLNPIQGGFFAGPPVFNQNLSSYLKSTDFSIVFGAGINLTTKLNLTIRYTVGITDINKNSGGATFADGLQPSFSTAYTRNQVLQVSLGYALKKMTKK